jgi:hypothetical protein
MRYRSLFASTAVLLSVAACKGKDARMSDDLAKDLSAAKTSDALALAPHAGVQTVVSAQELAPEGRAKLASSSKSSRVTPRHVPHRQPVTPAAAIEKAPVAAPVVATDVASDAQATTEQAPVAVSPRPQPVNVSYPSSNPGSDGGESGGGGSGSAIGAVIGAIGGAILRGGTVDGDHCDPRGHHGSMGGILIHRRGPIFRGNF